MIDNVSDLTSINLLGNSQYVLESSGNPSSVELSTPAER